MMAGNKLEDLHSLQEALDIYLPAFSQWRVAHAKSRIQLEPEAAPNSRDVTPELRLHRFRHRAHPVLGAEHHMDANVVGLVYVSSLRDSRIVKEGLVPATHVA